MTAEVGKHLVGKTFNDFEAGCSFTISFLPMVFILANMPAMQQLGSLIGTLRQLGSTSFCVPVWVKSCGM